MNDIRQSIHEVLDEGRDDPPPSPSRIRPNGIDYLVAAALMFTGIGHLAEIGPHWSEGAVLGVFFLGSTAVLFAQLGLVLTRPSLRVYAGAVVTSVVLIGLYVLVREASVPFVNHHDPYLAQDYPVKVAEALVAAAGVVRIRQLRTYGQAKVAIPVVKLTSVPERIPVIRTGVGAV